MKRLILLFLPFVSICINAEELKFVTVLSSPVGTFNKLEAVNPAVPAKSSTINFCTSIGNGGTVTLQAKDAAKHPTMNTVNMSSNTELGGNGGNYVLSRITMNKGGVLTGSRLLANTLQVNQPTAGKSDNLYLNNLTVAGAKTGKLHVNGTESYIETSHADPGMVWSNQYQNDKACGNTTECSKQYLLKQQGTVSTEPEGESACTEDSRGGCGSAYDASGNPSVYWKGIPLCSDVNGWAADFEGECVYMRECTKAGPVRDVFIPVDSSKCEVSNWSVDGNCSSLEKEALKDWADGKSTGADVCSVVRAVKGYTSDFDCWLYSSFNGVCGKRTVECTDEDSVEAIRRTCKRK